MSKEWKSFSNFLNKSFKSRWLIIGMIGLFVIFIITLIAFLTGNLNLERCKTLFWLMGIFLWIFTGVFSYHYVRYIWGKY